MDLRGKEKGSLDKYKSLFEILTTGTFGPQSTVSGNM
jgi:hypothetical protein